MAFDNVGWGAPRIHVELLKLGFIVDERTVSRSPWQNPMAERFVGSIRRELLDHVVVLSDNHLCRLIKSYLAYYHQDRCHLSLDKDTPRGRAVMNKPMRIWRNTRAYRRDGKN